FGDRAGQHHAGAGDGGELGGDLAGLGLVAGVGAHRFRVARAWCPGHVLLYIYSMIAGPPGDGGADLIAGYIAAWRPSSVPPPAAAFARDVIAAVAPGGRERAKNLLWAAAKLADYATGLGLDPVPEVLLHPSVIERFARCAPGLSGGVIAQVRGARPRVVPVLARYHGRLLAAAAFAGNGLICGGADPARRNITTPLTRSLSGGAGLPRLDTSRLRATWLADVAELP